MWTNQFLKIGKEQAVHKNKQKNEMAIKLIGNMSSLSLELECRRHFLPTHVSRWKDCLRVTLFNCLFPFPSDSSNWWVWERELDVSSSATFSFLLGHNCLMNHKISVSPCVFSKERLTIAEGLRFSNSVCNESGEN